MHERRPVEGTVELKPAAARGERQRRREGRTRRREKGEKRRGEMARSNAVAYGVSKLVRQHKSNRLAQIHVANGTDRTTGDPAGSKGRRDGAGRGGWRVNTGIVAGIKTDVGK